MLLLGHAAGSYDLDAVLAAGERVRAHPVYLPALILILLGALTKSAQFPFHFWLPQAMAAPTPVSAYLHSATLVKAGVFLLARLWPVLAGTEAWFWIVGTAGLVTLLLGAYVAIFQNDLKGLLAYSTISHLGLITLLLGLNSERALVAAVFHIVNHATFKASLFMAAGIIDHETGTRDIRRLSGLAGPMPFTARLATVAAAAMAGVPLLNGFLSKEMFFAEALSAEAALPFLLDILPLAAVVASAFSVAYSLRLIHGAFFGPLPSDLPRTPHEPPSWMRFPVEILVLICIVVGILPAATVGPALALAAGSILGPDLPYYSLSIWHGLNLPLLMSAVALALGVGLYLLLEPRLARGMDGAPLIGRLDGRRLFEKTLVFLSWRLARAAERRLGTRRLQPQLRLLVLAALAAGGGTVWWRGIGPGDLLPAPVDPAFALVWLVGGACALGTAWSAKYHRLAALILLGGTGLASCVTFVWLSAPDLALTQLLVEIVTLVLLLLGLRWLPQRREVARNPRPRGHHHGASPDRPHPRHRRGGRHGPARLRGHDAHPARPSRPVFPRECLYGRGRDQCGQRDPRGFPQLRHAGRNRRGGRGRPGHLRAAAALPACRRQRGHPRPAAHPGRLGGRPSRPLRRDDRRRLAACAVGDRAAAVSRDRAGCGLSASARA
nr:proton-conducting transporter membrane subunit [Rubellimicrobium thermophilum]